MLCAYSADIPLSQLENPKTAESALGSLGRSAEQLVVDHSLQGLWNLSIADTLGITEMS